MEFIVNNWYALALVIVFIAGGTIAVLRFHRMSNSERESMIREWLLQAVILAEREYGSGTGKLKLSSVYDKFCERFPWLAKVISFEKFSGYVDDSLVEMKNILKENNAIASVVEANGGE